MNLDFHDGAWDDYHWWLAQDKDRFRKLNRMLDEIRRTPYEGIGKPELLKGDLEGWWSRRLTYRDRIVYRVEGDRIEVLRLRFHYGEHR